MKQPIVVNDLAALGAALDLRRHLDHPTPSLDDFYENPVKHAEYIGQHLGFEIKPAPGRLYITDNHCTPQQLADLQAKLDARQMPYGIWYDEGSQFSPDEYEAIAARMYGLGRWAKDNIEQPFDKPKL